MPATTRTRAFGLTSLVRPQGLANPWRIFSIGQTFVNFRTFCFGGLKSSFLMTTSVVLSIEDKLNYLEQPLPPAPVALAGQQVAPEILAAHNAWVKGSKEIARLMLMTMDSEIQQNLENLHAYDMLQELKTLFAQQAEQELLQTTRDFHSCKQEEGQSVSSYVMKMKGYIDNLERLGHPVTLGLAESLILIGLRKEFDGVKPRVAKANGRKESVFGLCGSYWSAYGFFCLPCPILFVIAARSSDALELDDVKVMAWLLLLFCFIRLRVKGSKEIVGLMLMTMEPEIQQNLENLHANDMLKELKALFAQQAEQELLQTTRDFHACKQEEGQSVSSYVLKMKGYIDNLERLGHPVTLGLAVSLILIGLRKEFDGFVQNYNMHSLGKTVNELHAMLKLHEQTLNLPKNNAPALHAIRAGKVQKGKKHNKPQPSKASRGQNQGNGKNKHAYAPKPKIPPPPKREDPAKDSICHECGETGHWKRNCPQYLAELLKKKKNAASGAGGGSGIFVIELNTFLNRSWIYDTGCGTHICNTTQGLRASRKLKPGALSLYVGNGQREAVEAIGNFDLSLPSGLVIVLNNCHYAPSITRGVISVSRLYEDGFINRFVNNTIQVSRNNMVYFSAIPRDGIFEIDLSNSYTNENSIYTVSNKRAKLDLDSALLWHCRLGHISKKRIEKLQHDGLLNSTDLRAFEKCVPCMSGKMARKPYTHQVERAKDLLGLIHTDVCGPFKITSRQGANYFVTFTDDFSRYGYVYLLKHKHEVFETFKVFQKEVENQLGKTIKSLRSDRGGEYMSQEFLDHLKDYGIIAHRTPPYTPQHNGVSERRNRTLLDMVRSMMSQTTLPKSFWDYALETASCILNKVPTKKVEKTPYEVWHGQAPKLSYLKV
ncbi:zinc finger, CCHC-type containing protein [Tanacetum coccineum]